MNHIIALSGGKDSTALALRLAEVEPRDYTYLITPTGDELPEMIAHWNNLETLLGKPLVRVSQYTLRQLIDQFGALPNWRQRWCTRMIKIVPCLEYMKAHAPALLYVGLRADEEERQGIYSADVECRFPLREWGWGVKEVWSYLQQQGVSIPKRTDCARCYGQRLSEWFALWRDHPAIYADAEQDETRLGYTFRSPSRDTWPASLTDLRAEFEKGKVPRGVGDGNDACRVCRL